MAGLNSLLKQECVIHNLKARCKREALQALAAVAADQFDVPMTDIFSTLMEREQLGSTGVGDGIAIPHGKIDGLQSINGILARLQSPIDFDALDDQPVDLVFLLLAPKNATAAHLKALAKVSRLLRDTKVRETLRGAETADALYAIAVSDLHSDAA